MRERGGMTDTAVYEALGCTLGHVYNARDREPLIDCVGAVSHGFPDANGEPMPGGNLLAIATRKRLRSRRAAYVASIKKDRATLRAIERRLK